MADLPRDRTGWLPGLIGPVDLLLNGADTVNLRTTVDLVCAGATVADDEENEKTVITIPAGGGGSSPTGTGVALVSAGAFVGAAGTVNLASGTYVSGILPVANGGTGLSSLATFATLTGAQILTNKAIDADANTVTNIDNAGIKTGANIAVNKLAAGTDTYVLTTSAGTPTWSAPSGGSVPTGTGFYTITSGSADAASAPYASGTLAFISTPSSANLRTMMTDETGTGLLVFGTSPTLKTSFILRDVMDLFSYTFTPSVLAASRAITLPALSADDTFVFAAQAQTLTGKTMAATTNPASTGNYRLANTDKICARNAANSADACMMQYSAGDGLFIGLNSGFTEQAYIIVQAASAAQYFGIGSSYYFVVEAAQISVASPIVGYSSPYGCHGQVQSGAGDANYAVPSSEYKFDAIIVGTAWTAGRTMTFPHPASDAAGYSKTIVNSTGQTMTVSTGTGTTKTLANGLGQRFRFSSGGVNYAGATYTP